MRCMSLGADIMYLLWTEIPQRLGLPFVRDINKKIELHTVYS